MKRSEEQRTIERFRRARRDGAVAVLEGLHPIKHALRFGARLEEVVTLDPDRLSTLADSLAPELTDRLGRRAEVVPRALFDALAPYPPGTGVIALARRPEVSVREVLGDSGAAPVVFLDRPRRLGNIGAAVRVAAAAGAAGVLTTGEHDPWHPTAIRGGAGLQFAVPVARVEALPETDRPVVALDPGGDPLRPGSVPPRAVLAFGSERHGLHESLLARADHSLRIPMRPGVSSLNLATSVAVALYTGSGTS